MKDMQSIINDLKFATNGNIKSNLSEDCGYAGCHEKGEHEHEFPMTVLSTFNNGHSHEVLINEDGTGNTISTMKNGAASNNVHTHIIEDFVYFTETIGDDGKMHGHRIYTEMEEPTTGSTVTRD